MPLLRGSPSLVIYPGVVHTNNSAVVFSNDVRVGKF